MLGKIFQLESNNQSLDETCSGTIFNLRIFFLKMMVYKKNFILTYQLIHFFDFGL